MRGRETDDVTSRHPSRSMANELLILDHVSKALFILLDMYLIIVQLSNINEYSHSKIVLYLF